MSVVRAVDIRTAQGMQAASGTPGRDDPQQHRLGHFPVNVLQALSSHLPEVESHERESFRGGEPLPKQRPNHHSQSLHNPQRASSFINKVFRLLSGLFAAGEC